MSIRSGALSAWSVVAAFGAYFCVYGFRKPFTAGEFAELTTWGITCKSLFVTSQVLGYTVSKFMGIRTIAVMQPDRRVAWLLGLVASSHVALLFFALVPTPVNAAFLFLNGLALGMSFGLVMGFLEGRRHTEALLAGLCASFVLADGATKSVGVFLLESGWSESWMPFGSGLVFVPPLLVFAWMLSQIPRPSADDVAHRAERTPMNAADRSAFFWRYAFGLGTLIPIYLVITLMRSVRADFAPQIWRGLGIERTPSLFTLSELCVAAVVLLVGGLTAFIPNHRHAFFGTFLLTALGVGLVAFALVGWQMGVVSPFLFMVLIGMGLYIPYVLFHTTLFERLLALTRDRGNVGYLMYLADSFGYLGYVTVIVGKNFWSPTSNYLEFFLILSWACVAMTMLLLIPAWFYFAWHPRTRGDSAVLVQSLETA